MPEDPHMSYDPTIVGSWPSLAARLDGDAILVRWAATEPALAGLSSVHGLLAVWAEGDADDRPDVVLAALLLTLHLLSGLARTMARQLADLNPDILAVVVGELGCQIRCYPWQRRPRAIAANLRAETRRAVLAELRPSSRYHPDRVEVLIATGDITRIASATVGEEGEDLDVVDLLQWAVRSGVDAEDVALLIATECSRDGQHRCADQNVAAAHGITTRTLYLELDTAEVRRLTKAADRRSPGAAKPIATASS
jgi:hypothetical protein